MRETLFTEVELRVEKRNLPGESYFTAVSPLRERSRSKKAVRETVSFPVLGRATAKRGNVVCNQVAFKVHDLEHVAFTLIELLVVTAC